MLKPHVKKAWIAALRSGDYQQGQGSLRRFIYGWDFSRNSQEVVGYQYCCLGVLCDIGERKNWEGEAYIFPDGNVDSASINCNAEMFEMTGLTGDDEAALVDMNDSGKSFEEIANYIEENL